MTELYKSKVVFEEEGHTYTINKDGVDVQLNGITGILSATIFKDKYKDVPKDILAKAAEYGTDVHRQVEMIDSIGIEPTTEEGKNYANIKKEHNLNALANEYLVSDEERVASKIDIVFDDYSLADVKTTSELDTFYLSWQLSIYAYLFEKQNPTLLVPHLYAIWLRHEEYDFVEVQRIPRESVEQLLNNYFMNKDDEKYADVIVRNPNVPEKVYQLEQGIIDMMTQLEILKNQEENMKSMLKKMMGEAHVDKWTTDRLTITYIEPFNRYSFDAKRFQKDHPEIYDQYIKTTRVSEGLKIKINENIEPLTIQENAES